MAASAQFPGSQGPRRSVLDLAPLELDCMNELWAMGEGTVRQIRQRLAPSRPRAYTTIMTIMDRLARKGVVARRKVGRAYLYHPNISAEEARTHAVEQLVEGFFAGSTEALAAHLAGNKVLLSVPRRPRLEIAREARPAPAEPLEEPSEPSSGAPATRLDESLL